MAGWTPRGHQVISRSHWCNMHEGSFSLRPVWNCSDLMAKKPVVYKLGFTKNIKLFKYRHIDHTASPPPKEKTSGYLIICMDAYVICTWSSGKVNHRPADQRTESSPPQGSRPTKTERKDKRPGRSYGEKKTWVASYLKVRDGRRGDKNRGTNTQNKENKEQVGGGQKRSWRLIFEFWWGRAEPIRAADWDCDHWLSSSGPVSVSMLLLSVSEASVCSVDMDEMSLADEDWEAEPDTTSDTRERRDSHDRVQWRSESNCDLKHEERKKKAENNGDGGRSYLNSLLSSVRSCSFPPSRSLPHK